TNSPARRNQAASQDAADWVLLAEQKCIPTFSYKVTVFTQATTNTAGPSREAADQKAVLMTYSSEKGLRLDTRTGDTSFTVDIASMLKKMSGKASWKIESEQSFDGQPTVCVLSAIERLSVR